jgi:hypothetical protein
MVFVWGESGAQAAAEADAMPLPGFPDVEPSIENATRDKNGQPLRRFIQSYYRELPYGWEVLAENLVDPCEASPKSPRVLIWSTSAAASVKITP